MKKIASIILSAMILAGCSQSKTVELPLTMHDGYGPFQTGLIGLSADTEDPNNPWYASRIKVLRLPNGLTDVRLGHIETNMRQHVYQSVLAGTITQEWYAQLQRSWNWQPDSIMLSPTPVRTQIAFAYGQDADGATKFVLDANGNLDLSDDTPFTPVDITAIEGVANKDSLAQVYGVRATIETFVHDRIVPVEVPVLVTFYASYNMYFANLSRHATTEYKGQQLAVASFQDVSFSDVDVTLVYDDPAMTPEANEVLMKGEYIEAGGDIMKIVGVNTNKNVLVLELTDRPKSELISTQIGYAAYPFAGEEFTSRAPLSLESLRGKYVFIDFWATWCSPCIQEFPNLRELYSKTDRSLFEIVGIVGESSPDALTSMIATHSLTWPQILSDEIVDTYGVTGFPTTLLLDPEGVIVAKDLRGTELADKVMSLLRE